MVINPYVLYMKKNLTIYRLSTPSMTLIAQSKAEKRGTLLLLSSFGHPVGRAKKTLVSSVTHVPSGQIGCALAALV